MSSFLIKIYLMITIISYPIDAMDGEDKSLLTMEIVILNAHFSIKELLCLSTLNSSFNKLFEDPLWALLLPNINGHDWVKTNLTPKQKCISASSVLLISFHHKSDRETSVISHKDRIRHIQEKGPTIAVDDRIRFFTSLVDKKPQVLCSIGGMNFYCFYDRLEQLLELALQNDIVLILLNGGPNKWLSYPNVLHATKCYNEKLSYTTVGDLADIAVECENDNSIQADLELGKFCAYLRCLRPELKASEICSLVLQSSRKTKESLEKIPHGGILDREATIRATKDYQ